jgi:hypothetical protein
MISYGPGHSTRSVMKATHCPLCYELLEARDVAPCMDCGHLVDLALTGKYTYAEYRYSGDLSLVLCIYLVDFASYDPTYFGLPRGTCIDWGCFQYLRPQEWLFIAVLSNNEASEPRPDAIVARIQGRALAWTTSPAAA